MAQLAATTNRQMKTAAQAFKSFLTYSPGKVKPQEVVLFCRQLSSFVRVGVPVTSAIQTFAEQTSSSRLKEAYAAVVKDVEGGARLSAAFAARPQVFPSILTDMVRSAEVTGNLDVVLGQAARHIEREAQAHQKIRGAMLYPVIIATFAIIVTVGMVVFVLPRFRDLYASLGVPVPGILAGLLSFSSFLGGHALMITVGALLGILALSVWVRTEHGRYALDRSLLKLPVIAPLLQASMTERFCRTLGDMLSAGVPITQTYSVVIANVRNRVYRKALAEVAPAIAAGEGVFRPMQRAGVFTPAVVQILRVGEETGHLDTNLTEAADMHEEELDFRIKRLTAFLEPALIIFVGCVVGFVAITLVTSIYSLAGGYK